MSKTNFVPVGANIKVVGLGGAGCNAVTRMVREQIHGVEFIAMNTDAQQLAITEAAVRLQLGERLCRGMGAGGDHEVGHKAAEESKDEIKEALKGADLLFECAGAPQVGLQMTDWVRPRGVIVNVSVAAALFLYEVRRQGRALTAARPPGHEPGLRGGA